MTSRFRTVERTADPEGINGAAIAAGVVMTFALTVIVSAILAVAITVTDITEGHVSGVLYYIGLLTTAVGGGVASRRASSRGWLHGGLVGIIYVVVSLAVGLIIFPGTAIFFEAGRKLAVAFIAGALGGVVGLNL